MHTESIKKDLAKYDELIARAESIQREYPDIPMCILTQLRKKRALIAAKIGENKQSSR